MVGAANVPSGEFLGVCTYPNWASAPIQIGRLRRCAVELHGV